MAVPVPAQGRVKLSIKKEAHTFGMPGGPSSVALLQLPDYSGPYVIRSGLYFDSNFHELGGFGEHQLAERVDSLVAELAIDESKMNARYMVLHTWRSRGATGSCDRSSTLGGAPLSRLFQKGLFRVERSLEANIDASFQRLGEFGEERFTGTGENVTAELALGEGDRAARYLLLYTRGDLVGLSVRRYDLSYGVLEAVSCVTSACGFLGSGPVYWVERSLQARLEVETKPATPQEAPE